MIELARRNPSALAGEQLDRSGGNDDFRRLAPARR